MSETPKCECRTCTKIRERLERAKRHSGSDDFCGPCSSGSRGQGCDVDPAELEKWIREMEELLT